MSFDFKFELLQIELGPDQLQRILQIRQSLTDRDTSVKQEQIEQLLTELVPPDKMEQVIALFVKEFGEKIDTAHQMRRKSLAARELIVFFLRGEPLFNTALLHSALHPDDKKLYFLIENIPKMYDLPPYGLDNKRVLLIQTWTHLNSIVIKPLRVLLGATKNLRNIDDFKKRVIELCRMSVSRDMLRKLITAIAFISKSKTVPFDIMRLTPSEEKPNYTQLFLEAVKIYFYYIYSADLMATTSQDVIVARHADLIVSNTLAYAGKENNLAELNQKEQELFISTLAVISQTPSGAAVNDIRKFMRDEGATFTNYYSDVITRLNNPGI